MCKNQFITIAIDGAAGSGKSTTSQAICAKFKYIHVDTGLHYRSFSLFFMNQNISPDLVSAFIKSNEISLSSIIKNSSVYLQINDEYFPPSQLRNESMNKEVSFYARIPEVRSLLLSYQRNLVGYVQKNDSNGIVMDGRDIGSVVLPSAHLKFYLHADINLRQIRRVSDGENDSIAGRDQLDSNRKIAPLVCPEGAISIDTGKMIPEEVLEFISSKINDLL